MTNLFNNLQLSSNNTPNIQGDKDKLNNLLQSKIADLNKLTQSNNINANTFNTNDSQSLNVALQKLLQQQQQQQQQQKQLNTSANLNPAMLNLLQQQMHMQQQSSNKPTPPQPQPQPQKQPEQLPKLPQVAYSYSIIYF